MAEERLIDDDKDRKYKIRINEDGEEELIILDEEEAREELPEYEFAQDDELSPEQLAAREQAEQDEKAARLKKGEEWFEKAKKCYGEEDFGGAAYNLTRARELGVSNGEGAAMYLCAVTRGFTDFSDSQECRNACDDVSRLSDGEQKKQLSERARPALSDLKSMRAHVEKLANENNEKREQRRQIFMSDFKKYCLILTFTVIPLIVCVALALGFSTVMFAERDGRNIILTIVFASLAAVFLIAALITSRFLAGAQKNLSLNAKNSSTKLGREYEAAAAELATLEYIYAALAGEL